jgi:SAM-dependent methyltransferase
MIVFVVVCCCLTAGEWDDLASKYRDGFMNLLFETESIKALLLNKEKNLILDFGCGTGLLTEGLRKRLAGTQFVCIDTASGMIRTLGDKIQAGGWDNVQAYNVALSNYERITDESTKIAIDKLKGKVDLIVASSVISFIPPDELSATMKVLGDALKSGGILCHADWPKTDDGQHPDGFTDAKAAMIYNTAGLTKQSSLLKTIGVGGGQTGDVFFGVARKP